MKVKKCLIPRLNCKKESVGSGLRAARSRFFGKRFHIAQGSYMRTNVGIFRLSGISAGAGRS